MAPTYKTNPSLITPKRGRRGLVEIRYGLLRAGVDIPVEDCLVGVDNDGDVIPAGDYTVVATFVAEFAGFCPYAVTADANKDRYVPIYVRGNLEVDIAADSLSVGQGVQPVLTSGAVDNGKVIAATAAGNIIGTVVKSVPEPQNNFTAAGATSVEISVRADRLIDGWIPTTTTTTT